MRHFLALLRYAIPHKRGVAAQFALMGFSVGLGLLKPWPLKVLVDNVAGDEPLVLGAWAPGAGKDALLLLACLAYLLFHGGEALLGVASGAIATLTSSRMIRDLRADLARRLHRLPLEFHDGHRTGDLVHRVTMNSSCVETAFQSGFMGTVKSVLMLAGMVVVMAMMSIPMTLLALAVVPLLVGATKWYARRTHKASLEHQNQEGRVSSVLQEGLSAVRLVRAFNLEEREQSRFVSTCEESVGTRLRSTLVQKWFGFVTAGCLAAGTALMFWVGMREVQGGELTLGQFLVFLSYLAMLYSPLSVLSYTASSINSALGGATRLFEILEHDEGVADPPDPLPLDADWRALEARGVRFAYGKGRDVLDGVDLRVARGETLALVGETGGGKSTMLALLMRLHDPREGAILLDGTDIRAFTLDDLRGQFAFVPQECLLLSGSIRDNIRWARPDASDDDVERAARLARAHDFILEAPRGYDSEIGERGVMLSVGQRQRLSLARALLKDAPVLLLDEPTSALDAVTEAHVIEMLRGLGRTVVIAAHRLSTVRDADRIAVLRHGRVLECGSHDELMALGGAYHELWQSQASAYDKASTEVAP